MLYPVTLGLIKCSICVMLIRLFFVRRFKIAALVVMAICISWSVMTILTGLLICRPLSKFWNVHDQKGRCGDKRAAMLAIYTMNVITEVMIWCLPVPMVWQLKVPRAHKIALLGLFGLGIMYVAPLIVQAFSISITLFLETVFGYRGKQGAYADRLYW